MSGFNLNNEIASENSAARERGSSVAREYERVVDTFNKVLVFKEKVRLSIECRIRDVDDYLSQNIDKLNTLNRNIDIYDLNISKIAGNLEDLLLEETRVKEKYNRLLQGASMEMVGVDIDNEEWSEKSSRESKPSTENLMQQRHYYLDNLNSTFQKLDDDLQSISSLQTEMLTARSEIFKKKEQALETKAILNDNGRSLEEELESLESDLEVSVKEEEVLTLEYAQLINKVENCIVIGEDIDKVLFSSLSVVDV